MAVRQHKHANLSHLHTNDTSKVSSSTAISQQLFDSLYGHPCSCYSDHRIEMSSVSILN